MYGSSVSASLQRILSKFISDARWQIINKNGIVAVEVSVVGVVKVKSVFSSCLMLDATLNHV